MEAKTRALSDDEKRAMVLGIVSCISAAEIPDAIGVLISQRAIELCRSTWDALPIEQWENVTLLLACHVERMEEEKEKRKAYYEKHSN